MFHNAKELNGFDTIVVNKAIMNKIAERFNTDEMLPFLGILNEGVIRYDNVDLNTTQYIYFKDFGKQGNEHKVELQNYVLHTKKKHFMHVFTATIDYCREDRIASVRYGIFFAKKTSKENREMAFKETDSIFMGVLGYIHLLKDSKKTIVKYSDKSINHTVSTNNNSYNPNKRSVIEIEDISISVRNENSGILTAFRKQFNRHTESWTVMGHPRHYKNGKVVWVKPYVKGNKEGIKPKDYKLLEE